MARLWIGRAHIHRRPGKAENHPSITDNEIDSNLGPGGFTLSATRTVGNHLGGKAPKCARSALQVPQRGTVRKALEDIQGDSSAGNLLPLGDGIGSPLASSGAGALANFMAWEFIQVETLRKASEFSECRGCMSGRLHVVKGVVSVADEAGLCQECMHLWRGLVHLYRIVPGFVAGFLSFF